MLLMSDPLDSIRGKAGFIATLVVFKDHWEDDHWATTESRECTTLESAREYLVIRTWSRQRVHQNERYEHRIIDPLTLDEYPFNPDGWTITYLNGPDDFHSLEHKYFETRSLPDPGLSGMLKYGVVAVQSPKLVY